MAQKRRCLVTGGLGFIGKELVRQLSFADEVFVLDSRYQPKPYLADLQHIPLVQVDLTDRPTTRAMIKEIQPKIVFHLAAIHFIPQCNAAPDRTLRVNVEGTQNVLDAAVEANVEHLLLASTGAVYADSSLPLQEESPIGPVDIYGWSKYFAEHLCRSREKRDNLAVTVARLFNTYGPGETNAHIIPEIVHQLRFGDQLHLGNIVARRDYIHVADCASALVRLSHTSAARGQTINIASGCDTSVFELVQLLAEILDRKLTIAVDPARVRTADKQVQLGDITLLKSLLEWQPEIGLRDGLQQLVRPEGALGPGAGHAEKCCVGS